MKRLVVLAVLLFYGCGGGIETSSSGGSTGDQSGNAPEILIADTFVCSGPYPYSPYDWHYDVTIYDEDFDLEGINIWVYLPKTSTPYTGPKFYQLMQVLASDRYLQNDGACGNGIGTPKQVGVYKVEYQAVDANGNESEIYAVYFEFS